MKSYKNKETKNKVVTVLSITNTITFQENFKD